MPPKKQVTQPSLSSYYDQLVKTGQVKDDTMQRKVLAALESLASQLKPAKLFSKGAPVQGLYIWGAVGRGKSMLMDLFFEQAPVEKKRRVHFHAFMQEVHARIHQLRQKSKGDPVMVLARQLAEETSLLCFDELQAADVADATLLYRLFSGLFEANVVIVSTSNHPPGSLYTGGVQRERFGKFIALIEERMRILSLASPGDYRLAQSRSRLQTYFYPLGPAADDFVEAALKQLGARHPEEATLTVHGRTMAFTCYGGAIGRFTFHQLCESAMGAADYLAIAKKLKILILTDIPKLSSTKRNEARRFVTLIDALYEHNIILIAAAAAPPEHLYEQGDGAFEFKRTASRLVEMQSEKYLRKAS